MPPSLISIDLDLNIDNLLSKTWNKFLGIFGKDADSQELRSWLEERTRISFLQSRDVQCIGMHTPVLLSEIYQPTCLMRDRPQTVTDQASRRQWDAPEPEVIPVDRFLLQRTNAIITAGPGWGKTTFLHAVFIHFLVRDNERTLPILFTLREAEALDQLQMLVARLAQIKAQNPDRRILLLVDGYDEIPSDARKLVSEALVKFTARHVGEYYLTCRDYYEIVALNAPRLRIADFTEADQINFVRAFLHAYGSSANADEIVLDLHNRGFLDLLRHPLLLTLACIVRSGSSDLRSRNVISLIEAAIHTLSWRWDHGKGLRRDPTTPLDGNARVKCLKRLAFSLELEPASQQRVINITRKQLELTRWDQVDPMQVLMEIAQFYGIFVPIADRWGFVHRSLQDFLAAQYWVETGEFAKALTQGNIRFDSRTAFAGCLMEDATPVMELALRREEGLPIFAEMLMNDPSFNHALIAKAILTYYSQYKGEHYYSRTDEKIECHLDQDFISDSSSKFLDYIVQTCAATRSKTTDTLAAYAVVELFRRKMPLSQMAFAACKRNYASDKFAFVIANKRYVRLIDVPHASGTP